MVCHGPPLVALDGAGACMQMRPVALGHVDEVEIMRALPGEAIPRRAASARLFQSERRARVDALKLRRSAVLGAVKDGCSPRRKK